MFFRVVFTTLLLSSTLVLQLGEVPSPTARPILVLYGLIAGIFLLSFIYAVSLRHVRNTTSFAYLQIGIDTFIVTLIIFVTGGFMSIFSFLYLLVIICSSILLFRKGSLIMAALCSLQYGAMIDLEYYQILGPFVTETGLAAADYSWVQVLYKILITMVACFAVALLSSMLAEQTRRTRKELAALEEHVRRVQKMANMGEMAAGLAHEIKNPLASLAGAIQLLKEDTHVSAYNEKLMRIVLRETDRLSSLVTNFLLFARPPSGQARTIRLDTALTEILELFGKDTTCMGRIAIASQLATNVWVAMDPMHLRQILWNLLLNAAEAIEERGRIEVAMYPARGREVWIKIRDTGCGIPEDLRASIFDPFFTTKPRGTGLGLSIVHRILEAYKGRLDIESGVGQGTQVVIKLASVKPPT